MQFGNDAKLREYYANEMPKKLSTKKIFRKSFDGKGLTAEKKMLSTRAKEFRTAKMTAKILRKIA